jgi:hypothetical protein
VNNLFSHRGDLMSSNQSLTTVQQPQPGAMILGTGLAFASLILLPAVAAQLGVGAALTGAMRIALMRASSRVINGGQATGETSPAGFSCH